MKKIKNPIISIINEGNGVQHTSKIRFFAAAVLIIAVCIAVYSPAMKAGFIWDDDDYVTENPVVVVPDGLHRIWFTFDQPSQYFPMVYTTFRLEHKLWGFMPFGYHITNIALHTANALLLWRILIYLSVPGAWLAAAIFAIHPVQVESVAWITERKNVLMTFFYMLSFLAWLRFIDGATRQRFSRSFYAMSLLLYVFSLLSKTTACTMPAALALSLWIKHVRIDARRWGQIAPYVLLGLAMGTITMWREYYKALGGTTLNLNPLERILLANKALWFYVGKLLWPVNLSFSYPKWEISDSNPYQYIWLFGSILAAWGMWHWRDKIGRKALAATVFFVATLSPMLGLLSLYTFLYSYVADHYQYVACIGPIALITAAGCYAVTRFGRWEKIIAKTGGFAVLAVLGTLTWQQCHIYKDIKTLWSDVLLKNPHSWIAHNNLGAALQLEGSLDEAIGHYLYVLKVRPNDAEVYNNIGIVFQLQGKTDEAVNYYRKALQVNPNYVNAYYNMGKLLQAQGKTDAAIDCYRQAVRRKPDFPEAHYSLGAALQTQGKTDEAISCYLRTLRFKPDFAEAYNNIGSALMVKGKPDEAIEYFRQALKIRPDYPKAQQNLINILKMQEQSGEKNAPEKETTK